MFSLKLKMKQMCYSWILQYVQHTRSRVCGCLSEVVICKVRIACGPIGRGNQPVCWQRSPLPTCLHCWEASPCCTAAPRGSPWKTQSLDPGIKKGNIIYVCIYVFILKALPFEWMHYNICLCRQCLRVKSQHDRDSLLRLPVYCKCYDCGSGFCGQIVFFVLIANRITLM